MEYTKKIGKWDKVFLTKTIRFIGEGKGRWFCRIWLGFQYGQAYHKNKFTAYRLAQHDFNKNNTINPIA